MALTPESSEILRGLLAAATVEAFESGEMVRIARCLPPCRMVAAIDCPLCEIYTVLPNGTVVRETRGH